MRASPKISVLQWVMDRQGTIQLSFYFGDGSPFTDFSDVIELDNGGGVGYGHLSVSAGYSFLCRPVIIAIVQSASFGFFLSLFAITVSLFAGPISLFAGPISLFCLVLQPFRILSGFCQENVFYPVCSFGRLFSPPSHFAN